jgi:hypothetical protein|tara:strand:- start:5752 stop:6417 length:666 start_codon:yes stop_codon:yes gene_type:complete
MKLITEVNLTNEVNYLKESSEDGKKQNYYIEGVFLQSNLQNRNGRIYPKETMIKEVARYMKDNVESKRAYGELGHPSGPTINLDRVSHMIESLKEDGDNFIGKAKILDTPMGNIVKNLMDEGAQLGVSSRGMGSLKPNNGVMEVQGDFMLATAADIVADPSAPDAFVKGVMEGCEWVYDAAEGQWRTSAVINEIKETGIKSVKVLNERKIELFQKFLNSLV